MNARIASKECSDIESRDEVLSARILRIMVLDDLLSIRRGSEFLRSR